MELREDGQIGLGLKSIRSPKVCPKSKKMPGCVPIFALSLDLEWFLLNIMATHGGVEPLVVQSYSIEPHGKDMG